MKENRIKVIINKPIDEVFAYTINPLNTPKWISFVAEETISEYPIAIWTVYKNRSHNSDSRDNYTVINLKPNHIFHLFDAKNWYNVRYTYSMINNGETELEYFEWMDSGEHLSNPFDMIHLMKLKEVMETK
jgi:hypothetical protein